MTPKENSSSEHYFEAQIKEFPIDNESIVFVFWEHKLLLINGLIPFYKNIREAKNEITFIKYIGKLHHNNCFVLEFSTKKEVNSMGSWIALRQLYAIIDQAPMKAALYAYQIMVWNKKTQYCGQCGSTTQINTNGIVVKSCPKCKAEYYPKISPSIIVAVHNKDKILLAQHKRVTNGMYTVLAGFVDPGESLEECIHRELKEEAGIEVENIQYFGSQPWPFPDSLMIAFIAHYKKGVIRPDKDEIIDLKWFKAEEIPEWPDKVSIARTLIDSFIEINK